MDEDRFIEFFVWVVSLVLAIVFFYNGISKITGSPVQVAQFEALSIPTNLMVSVGVLEVFGALCLTVPRLAMAGGSLLVVLMLVFAGLHLFHDNLMSLARAIAIGMMLAGICYLRFKHCHIRQ